MKPVIRFIYVILFALLLTSCRSASDRTDDPVVGKEDNALRYAQRFKMSQKHDFTLLSVSQPWQNAASNTEYHYVLGRDSTGIPPEWQKHTFIHTPAERVVIFSTTYIGLLEALDELPSVIGVSGPGYIYNKKLLERYHRSELYDVGSDQQVNFERIISLQPDLVFLYGIKADVSRLIQRLDQMDIQTVICADYLEDHPLGRAEWIRFFGAFYDRNSQADSIFSSVASRYEKLIETLPDDRKKPTVFLGLPWKDTWYVAGGNSYAAQLIIDAGGMYVWDHISSSEAIPYDLESVFGTIASADIWLNPGSAVDNKDILATDKRLEHLTAFKEGRIYNNNKRMGEGGGNDYWESGIIRPDRILKDLIHIFFSEEVHPDTLYYYKSIK